MPLVEECLHSWSIYLRSSLHSKLNLVVGEEAVELSTEHFHIRGILPKKSVYSCPRVNKTVKSQVNEMFTCDQLFLVEVAQKVRFGRRKGVPKSLSFTGRSPTLVAKFTLRSWPLEALALSFR